MAGTTWYEVKEECPDPPNCTDKQKIPPDQWNAMVLYLKDRIRGMLFSPPGAGDDGKYIKYTHATPGFALDTPSGGVTTWLALTDTPAAFTGQKGLLPRVNTGETALEFKHNAIPTTFVVAATVANGCKDPFRADDQCDGTADQSEINTAITALPT